MQASIEIPPAWPGQLADGLRRMHLSLNEGQQATLLRYLAYLERWNHAYNLTAVRDRREMVRRQLLDSLAILPWVDAGPVLDVGSGAGLPGIPLAIARPDLAFSLLDSSGKRTRFLRQVVAELGLPNVEVLQERVELLERPRHYARIVSRAFSALPAFLDATERLLADGGHWLAMKGADPSGEFGAMPADTSAETIPLRVPDEPARRHLVVVRRLGGPSGAGG